MADVLITKDHGRVRLLTMNRPEKLNALNRELMLAIIAAATEADNDDTIGAIVLAGEGRAFCAGADLDDLKALAGASPAAAETHADTTMRFFGIFPTLSKPVIAAVDGYALGGGNGLAMACDMVLASEKSQFGFPEVKHGALAALVMAHLVRQLGRKVAFELVGLGERIDAAKALELGMINRVVTGGSVIDEAVEMARKMADYDPLAIAATKKLFHRVADLPLETALQISRDANVMMRHRKEKARALPAKDAAE